MANYEVSYRINIPIGASATNIKKVADAVRGLAGADTILNKTTQQLNNFANALNRLNSSSPKKIKIDDKAFNSQINNIQKKLNSIKKNISIKVTPTVGNVKSIGSATQKISNTTRPVIYAGGLSSTSRNGMNRAARGFGSGSRGLYGLSDVLYAAGFPFPNMIAAASIGMGLMSITKSFAKYENLMATVGAILKTTDKDTATFNQRLAEMAHNIRQVGVDTKFTTVEVAGAAKYLAMAGLSIQDINNSIRPIANLAIIGDAPIDRIADITTNIQTAYGLSSDKMTRIADVLTSVTNSTNTNVLEMGEAMKFAAPMMSLAHVSFNEAAAAMGIMANAGLKGTVAGTALRAMMVRLLNPTKKGQQVIDKYSLSLKELNKQTGKIQLKPLSEIFGQLNAKNATLEDIIKLFDKIGGNAANNLFARLKQMPDLIKRSVNSSGIADMIAAKKQDTIQGAWYRLTSQFTESGMRVYEGISPLIKGELLRLVEALKSPGAIQAIKDIVSAFFGLAEVLARIASIVMKNWSFWGTIIIGKFLFTRLSAIASGIFAIGRSISFVIKAVAGGAALKTAIAELLILKGVAGTAQRTLIGGAAAGAVGTTVGSGVAAGGGLLAAIGGIPTLIVAGVSALAFGAYRWWGYLDETKNKLNGLKQQITDIAPYLDENGNIIRGNRPIKENGKTISWLKSKNVVDRHDEKSYTESLISLGRNNAAMIGNNILYKMLSNPLNDSTSPYDYLNNIKKAEGFSYLGKPTYSLTTENSKRDINYSYINGSKSPSWHNRGYRHPFTKENIQRIKNKNGLPLINSNEDGNITENNISGEEHYNQGYNSLLKNRFDNSIFHYFLKVQEYIKNGKGIDSKTALSIMNTYGQIDLSEKSILKMPVKERATTIQNAIQKFKDLGASEKLVEGVLKPLEYLKPYLENGQMYGEYQPNMAPQNVSDPTGGTTGLGGGSGLSGVGNYKGQTPKQIIVNIHSLVDKVDCNFDKKDDLEKFKNKLSAVLVEVVADTEISLANDFS